MLEFRRGHYDAETKVFHKYQLYDFLKTSPGPGPAHFVIAYDTATRKTCLRADLRSNQDLDRLPADTTP